MANYLLWWLFLLPCRRCNCFWRLCSLHFNTASLSGGYPTCIHRFNPRLLLTVRLLPRDSIQYYNLLWRRCLLPSRYFSVLFLVRLSTTFGTSSAAQCFFVLIVVLLILAFGKSQHCLLTFEQRSVFITTIFGTFSTDAHFSVLFSVLSALLGTSQSQYIFFVRLSTER